MNAASQASSLFVTVTQPQLEQDVTAVRNESQKDHRMSLETISKIREKSSLEIQNETDRTRDIIENVTNVSAVQVNVALGKKKHSGGIGKPEMECGVCE